MFGGPDGTVGNPRGYDGIGVIAEEGGPLAKPGIEENRGLPAREELRTGDDLSGSEVRGRQSEENDESAKNFHVEQSAYQCKQYRWSCNQVQILRGSSGSCKPGLQRSRLRDQWRRHWLRP